MIEKIENSVQLLVVAVCFGITVVRFVRTKSRNWELLAMYYGNYCLGDLYWLLFLLFYGSTPNLTFISDLSWYAADLALLLLLNHVAIPGERTERSKIPLLFPLLSVGMFFYFVQGGNLLNNLLSVFVMAPLMHHAARGLVYYRKQHLQTRNRLLYCLALFLCLAEYGLWTISCFYWSDSIDNPYFWLDGLITLCIPMLIPAVNAVGVQMQRTVDVT